MDYHMALKFTCFTSSSFKEQKGSFYPTHPKKAEV